MNQAQWAAYKSALKTLDAGPKKIAQARAEYAEADKYMQEHKRTYSEVGQQNYYKTAQAKRDTAVKAEVGKIAKALSIVEEYRTFPDEAIGLSSVELQNALNIVNMMGKNLPVAQQISILENFRGQPATLNFLGDVYEKYGLYYSSYARELAKPISQEAVENLGYCVGAYEMLGKWPFEEKCHWTQNEFAEAAARYGFNMTDGKDAYIEALKAAREGKSVEEQRILSSAISKILNGREYMTDAQKAEIFENATAKAKAVVENVEAREINKQAVTQGLMDVINTVHEAQENAVKGGGNDGA